LRRATERLIYLTSSYSLFTPPPIEERSIVTSMSVCLFFCVCLSVRDRIFGTTRPIFTEFLHLLSMAVARSSSRGIATCYVLPVLRMTSCFHTVSRRVWRYEHDVRLKSLPRWQHRGRSLQSATTCVCLLVIECFGEAVFWARRLLLPSLVTPPASRRVAG